MLSLSKAVVVPPRGPGLGEADKAIKGETETERLETPLEAIQLAFYPWIIITAV